MTFLFALPIIGAVLGGLALFFGGLLASGAPQQAAAAAMAVALPVIPYVLARSVQIVTQDGVQKRQHKQLLERLDNLIAAQQTKTPEPKPPES